MNFVQRSDTHTAPRKAGAASTPRSGTRFAGVLRRFVDSRRRYAPNSTAAIIWGAFVGPLIAVASFTCSVGNVLFAAVRWNGSISCGGIASFISGDLIILLILNIYREYYGGKMTGFLAATFYIAMVAAALVVETFFQLFGWVPHERHTAVVDAAITFNYTTALNILFDTVFVVLATVLSKTGDHRCYGRWKRRARR